MDLWIRVLPILEVVTMAFADGFRDILWRVQTERYGSEMIDLLTIHTTIQFFMPKTQCLHVVTDGTLFAIDILEWLHRLDAGPSLTVEGPWSEVEGCKNFLVIAFDTEPVQPLQKLPRLSDHRILVIIDRDMIKRLENVSLYRDAEVVLINPWIVTEWLMLKLDNREFVPIDPDPTEPWEILEDGPGNFFGRNISVLTSNCTMFSQIGPINSRGEPGWTGGAEMIMFKEIAERLNLKPRFNVTNSIDAGLYKEPVTRDDPSDVAFCGILVSSRTLKDKKMTISQPLALLCLKMLVPRPKPVHNQWDEIFKTFTLELWLLTTVASLFITFFLQRFTTETRKLVFTKNIKSESNVVLTQTGTV